MLSALGGLLAWGGVSKGGRRVDWLVVTGHGTPFEANYPPFGVSQLHSMTTTTAAGSYARGHAGTQPYKVALPIFEEAQFSKRAQVSLLVKRSLPVVDFFLPRLVAMEE